MNDLIVTVDDEISALVWGRRVRAALEAGRPVVAINDQPNNEYCTIGTGDNLPGFQSEGLEFFSFPAFSMVAIDGLADPKLLPALDAAGHGTLVAWNIDILLSPLKVVDGNRLLPDPVPDTVWLPILERLDSGIFDNLMQAGIWSLEQDTVAIKRHRSVRQQSIAGTQLRRFLDQINPEVLQRLPSPRGHYSWCVLKGDVYLEHDVDYRTYRTDPKSYPDL